MEKLKILFIPSNRSTNTGSTRIWIHDLSFYLSEMGVQTKIGSRSDIPDYDIIILGKRGERWINNARSCSKKVGLINPNAGKNYGADFIIVGSIEEKDSLSDNENVIIFPLIERLYLNKPTKEHKDKDTIRFCFHGHSSHLFKFEPHLKLALEEFSKERNIELMVITGETSKRGFNWSEQSGRPNIKILSEKWSAETMVEKIQSCDIGLCPNISLVNDYKLNTSRTLGQYGTDYILRMKNKSNAGRSFVFHQLGIPVVADMTPSHFHIMGNPDCGSICMSKNGYLESFRLLSDYKRREFIAKNARKEFDRLYNPIEWAKKIYEKIAAGTTTT
jgi:hypothetical protein